MIQKLLKDQRTIEQIKEHYEIEKELASRLRNASRQERRYLYTSLYNELFRRVSHHQLLTQKDSRERTLIDVSLQLRRIRHFLNKDTVFLEVGPGSCALSLAVTKLVKQVYAVDVSEEIVRGLTPPQNFQLFLSDGCSIPVPQDRVTVAYSYQLMEHLHPDDALIQLQNIYKVLIPGGIYICSTPNRLTGPHDISKHFDIVATGFHLKEYSISELSELFERVGFSKVSAHCGGKGRYITIPVFPSVLCEKLLCTLPYTYRKSIGVKHPFKLLLDIRLIGIK